MLIQVFTSLAIAVLFTPGTPVKVEVNELRSESGQLVMYIFDSEAGFPGEKSKAVKIMKVKPKAAKAQFEVDLPPGTYAFLVLHDENANNKTDTYFLGMPKEGVAASRNAKGFMGPPDFEDAAFTVGKEPVKMQVSMNYM